MSRPVMLCFANARLPDTDYRVALARRSQDFDVRLVLPGRPPVLEENRYIHLEVNAGMSLSTLREMARIPCLLRRHRASYALFFATQFTALGPILARLVGVVPVITITGLGRSFASANRVSALRALYLLLFRFNAMICRAVLFQNPEEMGRLVATLPSRLQARCHLVGSGVDETFFSSSRGAQHPRCTMVGRLLPDKGILDLLEIAKDLHHSAEFVLIGPPSDEHPHVLEAVRRAEELGHVRYVGALSSAQVREELDATSVLVFPSYHEGFPRVVLEAVLSGAVVVAYDIAGCRAALGPGAVTLVPLKDRQALKAVTELMLVEPDLANREWCRARDFVLTNHRASDYVMRIEGLLK